MIWRRCISRPCSNPRRQRTGARFAACALLLLATLAPAQTLDLGGAAEPDLRGHGSAIDKLVRSIETDIERDRERLDTAAHAGDLDWDLAIRSTLAWRALARDLLTRGPGGEAARPIHFASGLTIAAELGAIDELARTYVDLAFATRSDPDRATQNAQSRLESARAAFEAFVRLTELDLGEETAVRQLRLARFELDRDLLETLDELRPAVAALGGDIEAIGPAWPTRPDAPEPREVADASRIVLGSTLSPQDREAIQRLLGRLGVAERSPVHRRTARVLATRIADAVRAADTIAGASWAGDRRGESRAIVRKQSELLLDRLTRRDAALRLDDITGIGALIERVSALEALGVKAAQARKAVVALARMAIWLDSPGASSEDRVRNSTAAADRVLQTALERPRLDAGAIEHSMRRRAWRLLEREYEQTERLVMRTLTSLISDPDWLTSPDVISAIQAHKDAAESLRRVASLDEWKRQLRGTGTGDPLLPDLGAVERSVRAGAADRLDALTIALGEDRARKYVLRDLAVFEDAWSRFAVLPGERLLRAAHPSMDPITAGKPRELILVFERHRQDWLIEWTYGRSAGVESALEHLARDERVGRALETCASLADADALAALDRWGALAISLGGVGVVRRDAKNLATALANATMSSDSRRIDRLLDRWDEETATARLLAYLAEAAATREDWPRLDGVEGLIAQLGSGVPTDSWGREHRSDLARVSRWLAELEVAAEDTILREQILAYLNDRAARIIETMPTD